MIYFENILFGDYKPRERTNPIFVNFAGYSKEDMEANVDNGCLYITANNEEYGEKYYRCYIPRGYDENKVKLSLKDGMLKISFLEDKKKRKLEIS